MGQELKKCSVCKDSKPLTEFHKKGNGREARCRQCKSDWYKKFREGRKSNGICLCGKPTLINTTKCGECTLENRIRVHQIQREIKRKSVEYLGEKCIDCGLKTTMYCVYDFHHVDPNTKDFKVRFQNCVRFERIKTELDKCVLLCSNCHRIRHYKERVDEIEQESQDSSS